MILTHVPSHLNWRYSWDIVMDAIDWGNVGVMNDLFLRVINGLSAVSSSIGKHGPPPPSLFIVAAIPHHYSSPTHLVAKIPGQA